MSKYRNDEDKLSPYFIRKEFEEMNEKLDLLLEDRKKVVYDGTLRVKFKLLEKRVEALERFVCERT